MRAVISVIGKDMVGILAKISTVCASHNVNVIDVTQTIMQDMFVMIMMTDISSCSVPFSQLQDELTKIGDEMGLSVHTMHEDIFNSMHKI